MAVHVDKKMRLDDNLNQGTKLTIGLYMQKTCLIFLMLFLVQSIPVTPTYKVAQPKTEKLS